MKKAITLYQKTKLGKTQVWSISVVEKGKSGFPEVVIKYGQLDGKMQTTFDIIKEGKNIGRSNETTFIQQAYLEMERKVTKQKEDGYKESIDEVNTEETIDFSKPMPKCLCFYKPKNKIEDAKLAKLEKSKNAILTLKRDGQMFVARSSSDFGTEIWSRKMDLSTDKFPHVKEALKDIPNKTILLGEMIFENKNGTDNFKLVSKICRSDPAEAIRKQNELGLVKYYIFDIAFLDGVNLLTTKTFSERRKLLESIYKNIDSKHVLLAKIFTESVAECMKYIEEKGLEGLVIWDDSKLIDGCDAFSFNGDARRPNCAFKKKNFREDDFIVRWDPKNKIGTYGKGKLKDWVGNVFIYQLLDGEEVFLGHCGGGLSEELRKFYTNPKIFPRVWVIKYEFAQPGTGKLRFPVFMEDRTTIGDKSYEECVISEEIIEAREETDE
ncbi:MAG: hypothetical protein WC523_04960 [Patescibacteria group bacterium]